MKNLPGVLAGVGLVAALHAVASIAVLYAGPLVAGPEGAFLLWPFWVVIGAAQWVYLIPAALLARARGFTNVAKGVLIGGIPGVLMSLALGYYVAFPEGPR